MSEIVIRVDGLGKKYQLGANEVGYGMLREVLMARLQRPWRWRRAASHEDFWALRDLCFDVTQGQILGIIGRNGAGKSTLLKILSRITEPTTGSVQIRGRVRALLEVGTGFHPELTGRENVYLNGAIMGMKRVEIARKFDEIVEFAEIHRFLDTPVKRYSSGMYTRLAFSIAAHLEPEILIIDEVLAVGDAAFQRKCLGKISAVAREGRTVLFVSHNMGVVQSLCSRAIVLRNGMIFADDTAQAAITTYLRFLEEISHEDLSTRTERNGEGAVRITRIAAYSNSSSNTVLATGRPARFVFDLDARRTGLSCSFTLYDHLGQPITFFDSGMHGPEDRSDPAGQAQFVCEIDALPLLPGRYRMNAAVMHNGIMQDHLEAATFVDVADGQLSGRPVPQDTGYGSILIAHRWIIPT